MRPSAGERAVDVLLALLKAMCFVALFFGSQLLVAMPVAIALGIQAAMTGSELDSSLLSQLIAEHSTKYLLIANMLTLFVVLTFYLVCRRKFSEALWLRKVDGSTLWEGAAIAPGFYLIAGIAIASLPEPWLESYQEASAGISTGGMVGALAVVVAAPLAEEIVFRGLVMTRFSQVMPGWLAVLLSAAIFGAGHGHPVWFAYAFVMGTIFGFIDLRAGSIWPSILGHMVFNSFSQIAEALESDEARSVFVIVLLILAVVLPIVNRVAARFRRKAKAAPVQEPPVLPGVYDFDPWDT